MNFVLNENYIQPVADDKFFIFFVLADFSCEQEAKKKEKIEKQISTTKSDESTTIEA